MASRKVQKISRYRGVKVACHDLLSFWIFFVHKILLVIIAQYVVPVRDSSPLLGCGCQLESKKSDDVRMRVWVLGLSPVKNTSTPRNTLVLLPHNTPQLILLKTAIVVLCYLLLACQSCVLFTLFISRFLVSFKSRCSLQAWVYLDLWVCKSELVLYIKACFNLPFRSENK